VAIGSSSGKSLTDGGYNMLLGFYAGGEITSGDYNVAIGPGAGRLTETGSRNLFLGSDSGWDNVSGNNNVAIGHSAGHSVLGSGNVFLGYQAGYSETGSNKLYLANADNTALIYGDFSTGQVGIGGTAAHTDPYVYVSSAGDVGIGTTSPDRALDIVASGVPQLRLSSDDIDYVSFEASNDGGLTIRPVSATSTGVQIISGNYNGSTSNSSLSVTANSLYAGTGLYVSSTSTAWQNGKLLHLSKTASSGSTAFTGDIAKIEFSQTFDGGSSLNSTGNALDISRNITLDNASNTHTISGALVTFSDNGTQTAGTLTHTGEVLSLTQNYTSSTGTVLSITGKGTGDLLNVFDNITEVFTILDGGNVGIGTTSPGAKLDVSGQIAVSNGSSSTPSIRGSDSDSGIYFTTNPGTYITVNGNNVFRATGTQIDFYNTNLHVSDGKFLSIDKVRARDGDGLALYDDGDNGIFIEDGGQIGNKWWLFFRSFR